MLFASASAGLKSLARIEVYQDLVERGGGGVKKRGVVRVNFSLDGVTEERRRK